MIPHKALMKVLLNACNLQELRLCDCRIISQECKLISQNEKLRHLKVLDLSCNPIRLSGFLALLNDSTSILRNLERLELYLCSINHDQIKILTANAMQQVNIKFSKLTYVNMSFNNLGPNLSKMIVCQDFGLLNGSLKDLYLSECNIKDSKFMNFLAETMQFTPSLEYLDLSFNGFNMGFSRLYKALHQHCSTFHSLVLEGNQFNKINFSIELRYTRLLERLDLSNISLNEESVKQLSGQRCHRNLKYLKLEKCQLTSAGFRYIVLSFHLESLAILLVANN